MRMDADPRGRAAICGRRTGPNSWTRYSLAVAAPHPHKVAICFDKAEDGRVICVGLLIDPRENLEVSSRFLRDIHLGLASAAAADSQDTFMPVELIGKSTSRRARPGPKGWPDDHCRRVAEIYGRIRESESGRRHPVKQFAKEWPCSEATAHRWLNRCRELGLLDPRTTKERRDE
jgi:hypothetical protein